MRFFDAKGKMVDVIGTGQLRLCGFHKSRNPNHIVMASRRKCGGGRHTFLRTSMVGVTSISAMNRDVRNKA